MSIFIRDTLNTSGTTPEDGQSPNVNPDFVGRTNRDTLSNLGANSNPDFITKPPRIITFEQIGVHLNTQWNTITYTGTEEMPIKDYMQLLFPNLSYDTITNIVGIIKDNEGKFYWPEFNYIAPEMATVIPGRGYTMRLRDDAVNLGFQPGIVRPDIASAENLNNITDYINKINDITINVHVQWNTIGYNRLNPINVRRGLYKFFFPNGSTNVPLHDADGMPLFYDGRGPDAWVDYRLSKFVFIIKNNTGQFYWPEFGTLMSKFGKPGSGTNFTPGQGYKIRIKDNGDDLNEIQFPFNGKWPTENDIDPRPLIDGGPE